MRSPIIEMVPRAPDDRRPDPEAFLRKASRDARPGKLKVYLGMAAGVGKTYKMLDDAHGLRRHGTDVVIGYVETHGRSETEARIGDLEVVPRKQVSYQGVVLPEMDLDAILEAQARRRRRRRAGPHERAGQPEREALEGRRGDPRRRGSP